MTDVYVDKSYVFAVVRVRYAELSLLNAQALDQLVSAGDLDEVMRNLRDRGWGDDSSTDPESMLNKEREKLWSFIDEIVADRSVFDVFRLPGDYNNLKAAIKESRMNYDYPDIYTSECTLDPTLMRTAIRERDYSLLPETMAEKAAEAHALFLRTADGQLLDIYVDRACLDAVLAAGEASHDEFLEMYAGLTVAAADIKIAVRAALTGKDRSFLDTAIAECPALDKGRLISAALTGAEGIASYLENTDFADAAAILRESPANFERWCDNLLTERMKSELSESFGLGPISAYILARENEIKSVRIIMSGKQNGFDERTIAERVRDPYV